MSVHPLLTGSGLLWAKGQGREECTVEAGTAAIFFVSLSVTSCISVQAIAWAVFGVYTVRALWLTSKILKSIRLSWSDFFEAARGALFLGGVTAGILYLVDMGLAARGMSAFDRLLLLIGVGLIVVTTLPICLRGMISSLELRTLLESTAPRSPGLLRTVMKLYARA
jgi:hypothetical protein